MGDARNVIQAIEHLRDADLGRPTDLGGAEVARGEGRLEADLEDDRLDDLVDVRHIHNLFKISRGPPAAAVNLLCQRGADVLDHLGGEIRPEQIRQEEAR